MSVTSAGVTLFPSLQRSKETPAGKGGPAEDAGRVLVSTGGREASRWHSQPVIRRHQRRCDSFFLSFRWAHTLLGQEVGAEESPHGTVNLGQAMTIIPESFAHVIS